MISDFVERKERFSCNFLSSSGNKYNQVIMQPHVAQTPILSLSLSPRLPPSLSLPVCVKSAVSARSSVHSQGVLRAGLFSEGPFNGLA